MGKASKAHRAKVAKRNANMKQQEKKMQKLNFQLISNYQNGLNKLF